MQIDCVMALERYLGWVRRDETKQVIWGKCVRNSIHEGVSAETGRDREGRRWRCDGMRAVAQTRAFDPYLSKRMV